MANTTEGAAHIDGPAALLPTTTIATFPIGSFLENIAVRKNGDLLVTSMSNKALYQVTPPSPGATLANHTTIRTWDGEVTGVVEDPNHPDMFYVSTGEANKQGSWSIWKLSYSPEPLVEHFVDVPEALWLNGSTFVAGSSTLLLADSLQGRIYGVHVPTKRVEIWLEHTLLTKMTTRPPWPGVNGLDIFKGRLYATNSDRGLLLKAGINSSSGEYVEKSLVVLQEDVCGDDFAFDAEGNLYMTTNPNQTVLKFPDAGRGERVRVGGAVDDEELTGATALAFGRLDEDRESVYVTTTGGLVNPTRGKEGPGMARVVRLDVGVAGDRS
jgi:sugar lactone lactonase YvrE